MPFTYGPVVRCSALTKAGQRCGITAAAELKDGSGQLVAEPLRRGGTRCRFHLCLFHTKALVPHNGGNLLLFLDFETTGLNICADEIVEIGLVSDCGVIFSTVVRPLALPTEGNTVASLWHHSGITLASFWHHFGITVGTITQLF